MRAVLSILIIVLLLAPLATADEGDDDEGLGLSSMFRLVFQKTDEAALETERQLAGIIGTAREFGAGETIFAFSSNCVHYYPVGDKVSVAYPGISPRSRHIKSTFSSGLKTQFEEVVQRDLGNVILDYTELIIC